MAYTIDFEPKAEAEYKKLDWSTREQVRKFIDRLSEQDNPRSIGKPLAGNLAGFWRYRVGSYRLIARIEDDRLLIVMLITMMRIEHRSKVYK